MVLERAYAFYDAKERELGELPNGQPVMRELERVVMLRVVDEYWMEHLDAMQDLRQGIGLRGYGSVKPIDAYKNEGFEMFEAMIRGIREGDGQAALRRARPPRGEARAQERGP